MSFKLTSPFFSISSSLLEGILLNLVSIICMMSSSHDSIDNLIPSMPSNAWYQLDLEEPWLTPLLSLALQINTECVFS